MGKKNKKNEKEGFKPSTILTSTFDTPSYPSNIEEINISNNIIIEDNENFNLDNSENINNIDNTQNIEISSNLQTTEKNIELNTTTKPFIEPIEVIYCPKCGMPPDFCEFGDTWETCKIWILNNYPHFYPNLKLSDILNENIEENVSSSKLKKPNKKTKEVVQQITVHTSSRAKRKVVTVVTGLDTFGINLNKASKIFAKLFSCGVSVVKSPLGNEEIDIQGNIEDIGPAIVKNFPEVPLEKIIYAKPK